jgi:hypothetical protein
MPGSGATDTSTVTNYRNGAAFERKVRDLEYELGATLVVRSAGSRGAVDLVSFYPDSVKLIQCKNNGVLSKADRHHLCSLAGSLAGLPVRPCLAHKSDSGIVVRTLTF